MAKKLKTLKGLGASNTVLPEIPLYVGSLGDDAMDPLVYDIWQSMGGKESQLKTAEQAANLKRTTLPQATTPELVVYLWLKVQGYDFEYQVEVNGGRSHTGGSVVDFVVRSGKEWAWRIQGEYWHTGPEQAALDAIRKKFIIGGFAGRYQIDGVVDIWENRLKVSPQETDSVLRQAAAGYQLPHSTSKVV